MASLSSRPPEGAVDGVWVSPNAGKGFLSKHPTHSTRLTFTGGHMEPGGRGREQTGWWFPGDKVCSAAFATSSPADRIHQQRGRTGETARAAESLCSADTASLGLGLPRAEACAHHGLGERGHHPGSGCMQEEAGPSRGWRPRTPHFSSGS